MTTLLDWLRDIAGSAAPRKAAPRAIAAPARSCWTCRRHLAGGQRLHRAPRPDRRPGGPRSRAPRRRAPHPVQARWPSHASQCGFCTPGFVMAYASPPSARSEPRRSTMGRRQSLPLHRLSADRRGDDGCAGVDVAAAMLADRARRHLLRRQLLRATYARRACCSAGPHPDACSWPAAPISACWPAATRNPPTASSMSRTCPTERHRGRLHAITFGAAMTYPGHAVLVAAYPGPAPYSRGWARGRSGHRHDRRQSRQCLADRRHAAGAAGNWGATLQLASNFRGWTRRPGRRLLPRLSPHRDGSR